MNRRELIAPLVAVMMTMALGFVPAPGLGPTSARAGETRQAVLTLGKLTCASCTFAIQAALRRVNGVTEAKVSYREKRAVVNYDPARVRPEALVAAVEKAGFTASMATPAKTR